MVTFDKTEDTLIHQSSQIHHSIPTPTTTSKTKYEEFTILPVQEHRHRRAEQPSAILSSKLCQSQCPDQVATHADA